MYLTLSSVDMIFGRENSDAATHLQGLLQATPGTGWQTISLSQAADQDRLTSQRTGHISQKNLFLSGILPTQVF